MAEKEQEHRHIQGKIALDADVRDSQAQHLDARIGQILGFCIGVIAIVSETIASVKGAPWPGGFIGGAGVIGRVGVFIIGRNPNAS